MAFVNSTYYNSAAYYAPLLFAAIRRASSLAATLGVKLFYFSSTSLENLTDPSFKISTWGAVPGVGSPLGYLSLSQSSLAVAVQQEFFAVDGTELGLTRALKAKA